MKEIKSNVHIEVCKVAYSLKELTAYLHNILNDDRSYVKLTDVPQCLKPSFDNWLVDKNLKTVAFDEEAIGKEDFKEFIEMLTTEGIDYRIVFRPRNIYKYVWLDINSGFGDSWIEATKQNDLSSVIKHAQKYGLNTWKLIEYRCLTQADFQFDKNMKLR